MKHRTASKSALRDDCQFALLRLEADVFQALGHATRIHIIECLQNEELSVQSLLKRVDVEPANLSQHLGVLRSIKLVTSRKEGNRVWYALRDPIILEVLKIIRRWVQSEMEETRQILAGVKRRDNPPNR